MNQAAASIGASRQGAGRQPLPAAIRPGATVTWPLEGEQPERAARAAVAKVLARLGVKPSWRDDADLAVQELAVNARQHAPGPYELRVRVGEQAVRIAVADSGAGHAAIARMLAHAATGVPSLDERGRGLQIIAALFPGACGARQCGSGKEVWISIPLRP